MNWFYAVGGQQVGPVSEAQFAALLQAGTVTAQTLVWREGMANWQPYGQAVSLPPAMPDRAAPSIAGAAPAGGVICCECGQTFAADQVIRYGDKFVCAVCKPIFVQRLTEGAPLGTAGSTWLDEQQVLARDYRIEIGDCLGRAWKLFTANPGLILGTTLLLGVLFAGCFLVSFLIGMVVPFINVLLGFLYTGPLAAGFLWFFLRLARGEAASISDALAGFGSRFGQLVLASLVQGLLTLICMLPMVLVAGAMGFSMARAQRAVPDLNPGLLALCAVFFLVGMAGVIYLSTIWVHSLLLIIDKRLGFWPAMELSRKRVKTRWLMTFLFLFVASLISGLGVLVCGVGLLVTIPLYHAMKVYLYDDNFRDLAPQSD